MPIAAIPFVAFLIVFSSSIEAKASEMYTDHSKKNWHGKIANDKLFLKLAQVSEEKADRDFWKSIEGSDKIEDFKSYLEWFPNGKFVSRAKTEIERLKSKGVGQLKAGKTFKDCDFCPEMVVVPAGSFMMGSPKSEKGRFEGEGPQHKVTFPKPFAVGKYEITVDQFENFVRDTAYDFGESVFGESASIGWCAHHERKEEYTFRNPGFRQTGSHPVTCVSWHDAKTFADWLRKKTGKKYRLLSESEWEYVARAGTSTPFTSGMKISSEQANYSENLSYDRHGKTVPVDSFQANNYELYNVHGNVWEWVEDCWHDNYQDAPADGSAWLKDNRGDCNKRVMRGGSWRLDARRSRSAMRAHSAVIGKTSEEGFRVARSLD